jgi:hypothetical protein
MIELSDTDTEDLALFRRVCGDARLDGVFIPRNLVSVDRLPYRATGRYMVVHYIQVDAHGHFLIDQQREDFVTKRKRVKIPGGHPWRGRMAGRAARLGAC